MAPAVAANVTASPDGKRAAVGGADGTVRVWNMDTGKEVQPLTGPVGITKAEPITAILSGDGVGQRAAWLAGMIARTIVPSPGWLSMSSVPPSPVARSCIVLRPK